MVKSLREFPSEDCAQGIAVQAYLCTEGSGSERAELDTQILRNWHSR